MLQENFAGASMRVDYRRSILVFEKISNGLFLLCTFVIFGSGGLICAVVYHTAGSTILLSLGLVVAVWGFGAIGVLVLTICCRQDMSRKYVTHVTKKCHTLTHTHCKIAYSHL